MLNLNCDLWDYYLFQILKKQTETKTFQIFFEKYRRRENIFQAKLKSVRTTTWTLVLSQTPPELVDIFWRGVTSFYSRAALRLENGKLWSGVDDNTMLRLNMLF